MEHPKKYKKDKLVQICSNSTIIMLQFNQKKFVWKKVILTKFDSQVYMNFNFYLGSESH